MKTEGLYIVVEKKNALNLDFYVTAQLNPSHKIFTGHFPNHPVLPGVAMLQIVKELLEKHLKKPLFLKKVNRIKYLNIVNPNVQETLVFQFQIEEIGDTIKVKNNCTFADGTPVMHGVLVFSKK